jgi:hypothetical protein
MVWFRTHYSGFFNDVLHCSLLVQAKMFVLSLLVLFLLWVMFMGLGFGLGSPTHMAGLSPF